MLLIKHVLCCMRTNKEASLKTLGHDVSSKVNLEKIDGKIMFPEDVAGAS
jgi:hypothetical protein